MTEDTDAKLMRFANSAGLVLASRLSGALILPALLWMLLQFDVVRQDMASVKTSLDIRFPAIERRLDSLEAWRNSFDVHMNPHN